LPLPVKPLSRFVVRGSIRGVRMSDMQWQWHRAPAPPGHLGRTARGVRPYVPEGVRPYCGGGIPPHLPAVLPSHPIPPELIPLPLPLLILPARLTVRAPSEFGSPGRGGRQPTPGLHLLDPLARLAGQSRIPGDAQASRARAGEGERGGGDFFPFLPPSPRSSVIQQQALSGAGLGQLGYAEIRGGSCDPNKLWADERPHSPAVEPTSCAGCRAVPGVCRRDPSFAHPLWTSSVTRQFRPREANKTSGEPLDELAQPRGRGPRSSAHRVEDEPPQARHARLERAREGSLELALAIQHAAGPSCDPAPSGAADPPWLPWTPPMHPRPGSSSSPAP